MKTFTIFILFILNTIFIISDETTEIDTEDFEDLSDGESYSTGPVNKQNSSGKQLSGGAIAGIIIGCFCGIIALSIIIIILSKQSAKPPVNSNALSIHASNENINNSQ